MKDKVLIFGGTTEGRVLSDILRKENVPHKVSVATEYGRDIEIESGETEVLTGRLSREKIKELLSSEKFGIVVDATHPFAVRASDEIRAAAIESHATYLRLSRNTKDTDYQQDFVSYVDSMKEAGEVLKETEGNILLLTGSRDLQEILGQIGDIKRVYARVLPSIESITLCQEAGLSGKQIIAMQGPFSSQINASLIKEVDAKVILTKESGITGGYYEKLEAARQCGIKAVVVRNPENIGNSMGRGENLSMEEVLKRLSEQLGITFAGSTEKREIILAGIGPGDEKLITVEAFRALEECEIIFGAPSVVDRLESFSGKIKNFFETTKIIEYLQQHLECKRAVVAYSGDISVSSGAKKSAGLFEKAGYKVCKLSGISSVSLFANRLGVSLEDVRILSAHGRKCNVAGYAMNNPKLIVLPSDISDAKRIIGEVIKTGNHFRIICGCDLGSEKEKLAEVVVRDGRPDIDQIAGSKVLLYIENMNADRILAEPFVRDQDMVRGDVPMTKEEIRALSIRRLELTAGSIFYDIGAGTGSISIEAALLHPDIEVYSFEKNKEAAGLLLKNKEKYGLTNIHIVEGTAPEGLADLPKPSHVFIGGSGGKLEEILEAVLKENSGVRIVLNCVTLETLARVTTLADKMNLEMPYVSLISVTRYHKKGHYHMADALNPVYIVVLDQNR
ncbi:precorrin-6A reductase [Butyrivibrio sp. INlla14]|uniref:precorrin-6A reductase n=1 Tax=Butyrivibrio sp. INlla14 TaxID=1520808 RepID=UPI0008761410|nr:precorrin-6A reductase [Butyrivibrio sp. INlla14]SCY02464.1 precorrin-6Y C5,15-methyltransferase (decarboxylating) [Butyrivibrio sp. INlla14]